eukprot:scaffold11917_cov128-Isochrysis_galbana.AAC.7
MSQALRMHHSPSPSDHSTPLCDSLFAVSARLAPPTPTHPSTHPSPPPTKQPTTLFPRAPQRDDRISCRMQLVMWWSGLRGAISFALAMTLDDTRPDRQVRLCFTGPDAIDYLG